MNFFKELVSQNKKRYKDQKYNLDLSYITERIIAMAYPASGFEKIYRNNINKVAQFLNEKHQNNYYVINISNRNYDYSKFNNHVQEFLNWPNHNAPFLEILFNMCQYMDKILTENDKNAVVIHCLAGKGRTGTLICCYLLYVGACQSVDEALKYYESKRFNSKSNLQKKSKKKLFSGVSQPNQIRYIHYFHEIVQSSIKKQLALQPKRKIFKKLILNGIPIMNYENQCCCPYILISQYRSQQLIVNTKEKFKTLTICAKKYKKVTISLVELQAVVLGDIEISVKHQQLLKDKKMFSLVFNTMFIPESNMIEFQISQLSPDKLQQSKRFPKDFTVQLVFDDIEDYSKVGKYQVKKQIEQWNETQLKEISNIKQVLDDKPTCQDINKTLFFEEYNWDFFEKKKVPNSPKVLTKSLTHEAIDKTSVNFTQSNPIITQPSNDWVLSDYFLEEQSQSNIKNNITEETSIILDEEGSCKHSKDQIQNGIHLEKPTKTNNSKVRIKISLSTVSDSFKNIIQEKNEKRSKQPHIEPSFSFAGDNIEVSQDQINPYSIEEKKVGNNISTYSFSGTQKLSSSIQKSSSQEKSESSQPQTFLVDQSLAKFQVIANSPELKKQEESDEIYIQDNGNRTFDSAKYSKSSSKKHLTKQNSVVNINTNQIEKSHLLNQQAALFKDDWLGCLSQLKTQASQRISLLKGGQQSLLKKKSKPRFQSLTNSLTNKSLEIRTQSRSIY